jgi:SAM-dependent methyltransferase
MKVREMQVKMQEAIEFVRQRFPFKWWMNSKDDVYMNITRTVLRYLQPRSRILDFGCGPCDKIAVLRRIGFDCSACDDLQENWHKIGDNREKILAFSKHFSIDFRLSTGGPLPFENHYFDMVMIHDVLEHLHDSPRNLLSELLELVKPEGFLFATVPNSVNIRKRIDVLLGKTNLALFDRYYWSLGPWRGHIREYTRDDLVKLSRFLNLQIVELRSCHHMLKKLPSIVRPLYLAVTAVFPGWRDTWLLLAKKPAGWAPCKTLPQNELTKIILPVGCESLEQLTE